MIEYEVATGGDAKALQARVNALIANGFKPLGGVFVIYGSMVTALYQAMVKEDEA